MKKLLYISNLRLPTEKAYGVQITKMCEVFASLGIKVTLLFPRRRNPSGKNVFDYYGIKKNFDVKILPAPDFYLGGKLAVHMKNLISALTILLYGLLYNFDIIFSRDELPLYLLSYFKKNLIFEAHKFSKRRVNFYNRFIKIGIKVVVISTGLKKEFLDHGFKSKNILLALDGVDLEQFDTGTDSQEARRRLNLPPDKKLIGYVGSFTTMGEHKGLDVLFEALVHVKDALLVLVGGAAAVEDENSYQSLAESLGISERVIFVGRVEHQKVPVYLKAFDALIMPFPYTNHYAFYMSPLKLFEYMASDRPIVSTDLPSIREVLNHDNAVLVRPDDIQSLADGITKVLENPDIAQKIAGQALSDVAGHTWNKRADAILNFIGIIK